MWRAGWDLYWESGVARNMRFLTSNQTMNGFRRVPGGAADQAMTAALAAMTEAVERLKAGVPPKTPDFIAGTKDTEDTSR